MQHVRSLVDESDRDVPEVPPWTTHPDELALILACTRTVLGEAEAKIRDLLHRELDWAFILDQSARHGVDAMVYHHVAQLEPGSLPPDVREGLQAEGEGIVTFNLHRLRVLLQLVETLQEEDIPVLPFKGPLLAKQYYENLGFRRFVDLDLLVPRADIRRARTVLLSLGFEPSPERSDDEITRMLDDQIGLEFMRSADDLWVELHWALLNKSFAFSLDPSDVWARAGSHRVHATDVPVLAPEDLLLYLCAHGTKHHWARLKWICDVAEVCRRASDLNWDVLMERAQRLDSDRMLFLGLRLATRWLDAPVPSPIRRRFDDEHVAALARHVEARWLFSEAGLDRTPRWEQLRFFLRTRRQWRNRWPILRQYGTLVVTPTDKDEALVDLPASLSFLYYLIRPFRLLGLGWRRPEDPSSPQS